MARQGVRYQVVEGHIVADPKTLQARAAGRPDDRRDPGPGQHRDARLPEGPEGHRGGLPTAAGCIPATSLSGTRRITSRSRTARRTSSFRAARTFPRVEVEIALYKHPATALAAVVARPDEKWGETPCAFVQLKPGRQRPQTKLSTGAAATCAVQGAEEGGVRTLTDHCDRQDPEIRAAGAGARAMRNSVEVSPRSDNSFARNSLGPNLP